jgi:hypothetical protein
MEEFDFSDYKNLENSNSDNSENEEEDLSRFSENLKRIKKFPKLREEIDMKLKKRVQLAFGTSIRESWLTIRKKKKEEIMANHTKEVNQKKKGKKFKEKKSSINCKVPGGYPLKDVTFLFLHFLLYE